MHAGAQLGRRRWAAGPSARVPKETGQKESWRERALDKSQTQGFRQSLADTARSPSQGLVSAGAMRLGAWSRSLREVRPHFQERAWTGRGVLGTRARRSVPPWGRRGLGRKKSPTLCDLGGSEEDWATDASTPISLRFSRLGSQNCPDLKEEAAETRKLPGRMIRAPGTMLSAPVTGRVDSWGASQRRWPCDAAAPRRKSRSGKEMGRQQPTALR